MSHQTIAALLATWGYSLQANRKTKERQDHPDRDDGFEHVNRRVRAFQRGRQPVISVDATKKELIGGIITRAKKICTKPIQARSASE